MVSVCVRQVCVCVFSDVLTALTWELLCQAAIVDNDNENKSHEDLLG